MSSISGFSPAFADTQDETLTLALLSLRAVSVLGRTVKYSVLSICGSLETGSPFTRWRIHARRRTKEFHHPGGCQENILANMKLYSHPLSSTPTSLLTCHSGHAQTQLGSGTCAVSTLVGLGLCAALVQFGGSSWPSAFGEKRGRPHRNPPLSFSYNTSMADSGVFRLSGLLFAPVGVVVGTRGRSIGVGSTHSQPPGNTRKYWNPAGEGGCAAAHLRHGQLERRLSQKNAAGNGTSWMTCWTS